MRPPVSDDTKVSLSTWSVPAIDNMSVIDLLPSVPMHSSSVSITPLPAPTVPHGGSAGEAKKLTHTQTVGGTTSSPSTQVLVVR